MYAKARIVPLSPEMSMKTDTTIIEIFTFFLVIGIITCPGFV